MIELLLTMCYMSLGEKRSVEDVDFMIALKHEIRNVGFKAQEIEILTLIGMEGLEFKEAAEHMEISEKRARNLHSLAKKKLHLAIMKALEY